MARKSGVVIAVPNQYKLTVNCNDTYDYRFNDQESDSYRITTWQKCRFAQRQVSLFRANHRQCLRFLSGILLVGDVGGMNGRREAQFVLRSVNLSGSGPADVENMFHLETASIWFSLVTVI